MSRWLGAHVSIAGGLDKAFARGGENGCTALQVFTKNANSWQAKPLNEPDIQAFRQAWRASGIGPVLAHTSYLINLASPQDSNWARSKAALRDELERCAQLSLNGLVLHPGAHIDSGVNFGIARIRKALNEILAEAPASVPLLLENTAGQGSYLGGDFEHLARLLEGLDDQRVGICFDTCHAHAAGYDLSTPEGYQRTMAEFDQIVGLQWIRAFHLNDSLKPCGSRVDRHAHIGEGTIGRAGFACLMQDSRFTASPMLLETPKGDDGSMDRINLNILKAMAGEAPA